jgi:hypothetical protein
MDRSDDIRSTEDTTANREHVHNAEENRDALAAQAERTRATTPAETDMPIGAAGTSGAGATGTGTSGAGSTGGGPGMDNSEALRAVAENREALAEENRRVAATTPDNVPMTGPDTRRDGR